MATQRIDRKLTKVGRYSYSIIIPKDVVRDFKWKERQKLELKINSRTKRITVEDWKK